MREKRLLWVALLVLVVGGLAGLWAWKARGRGKARGAATAGGKAGARARFAGAVEPEAAPMTGPRALESHDDDRRGALRLEGQVIDADEQPVAGARVALDANPRRVVDSAADGSFVFDALVARDYTLEAASGDAHAGPVTTRVHARSEPVILRLRGAGSLQVTVVEATTRRPVAGASVELRSLLTLGAQTDAAGVATVRGVGAGWPILVVTAPGFAPARRMLQTAGAGALERQLVELRAGALVSGRVVDAAGKPVAEARVLPEDVSEPFPVLDARSDAAVSDAEGRFAFSALPAGTFRFVAQHAEAGPGTSAPLTLDGLTPREGIEIRLEGGARLAGRVVDGAGAGVAAATVRVALREGLLWSPTRVALADDDGRFDLRGLPRRAVDVLARSASASSAVVVADLAATPVRQDLVLTLEVDGVIAGVVVTPAGEPIPEALVQVVPELQGDPRARREWGLRGFPRDIADGAGRFSLGGLPPGAYRLRAARPGAVEDALEVGAGLAVKPGDREVRIVVPEDGVVRGRVAYQDGSTPGLYAVGFGTANPAPFASPDGAFRLRVPGGKQAISVTGPTFLPRHLAAVDVKTGDDTELGTITVEQGRSISGRVLRSDGTPVEAALVAGGSGLTGTGTELYVAAESPGSQSTSTDAAGRFVLTGLGPRPLVVIAEHAGDGRSLAFPVPPGDGSAQVTLVLQATGALAGKITRAGKPLEKVVLLLNPRQAPSSTLFLTTGADGSYRFDKVSPGAYTLTVMIGGGGARPGDMYARLVDVRAGETATLDIGLGSAGVTLDVTATEADGAVAKAALVWLVSGSISSGTMDQLFMQVAERGPGSIHTRMALGGKPAHFESVESGAYTACAIGIPLDINDPSAMQRMRGMMGVARFECTRHEVAAAPATQSFSVPAPMAKLPAEPPPQ
ncbi:MAG: carboxypeptidase regulatory-like domain-containing protein [Deltaproteobacteria bacterium]|nr:carboxypeptidase regulatory-like domain-containing protein [Deltaproteobacteria bacterium]